MPNRHAFSSDKHLPSHSGVIESDSRRKLHGVVRLGNSHHLSYLSSIIFPQ